MTGNMDCVLYGGGTRENQSLVPALQVLKAGSFCLNVRLINTLTLFCLGLCYEFNAEANHDLCA